MLRLEVYAEARGSSRELLHVDTYGGCQLYMWWFPPHLLISDATSLVERNPKQGNIRGITDEGKLRT